MRLPVIIYNRIIIEEKSDNIVGVKSPKGAERLRDD